MNNDILIISYGKVKNHIFSKVSGTSSPIYSRFVQQLVAQVPWGHNIVLMEKIKDKEIRKIYAEAILKNGWGRDMLSIQINNG